MTKKRKTVFKEIRALDIRLDYEKSIWICPQCGAFFISLAEPGMCRNCNFWRPGRSDPDYEEMAEWTDERVLKALKKKLGG